MNLPRFSRRSLASSCAAALLLGSPALCLLQPSAVQAAGAVVEDAASAPVFYPFTDPQGQPITSVSGQQGKVLTYQTAADNAPTGYSATGLPGGLQIDPASGLISGAPTEAGTFTATLSATNSVGVGTATLTFVIALPLPKVIVTADTPNGYPAQGVEGSFTITRQGDPSADILVSFLLKGTAKSGTDFSTLKLTKKIKAGKTSKRVVIRAVDESGEGISKKALKVFLQPGEGYTLGDTTSAKVKINYTP